MEPNITIGGSAANIGNDVANLAPLATTWSGANNGVKLANQNITQTYQAGPSGMAKFAQFATSLGKESVHMIGSAADFVLKSAKDMATSVEHFPITTFDVAKDALSEHSNSVNVNNQINSLQSMSSAWKSGKITTDQFKQEMASWQKDQANITKQVQSTQAKAQYDGNQWAHDSINAGMAVITIMTAGIGGAAVSGVDDATIEAANMLKSSIADPLLQEGESAISKISTDASAFQKVGLASQQFIKRAVNQVLFNGASDLTKAQMIRASSTNLLLNYPLTYNALSSGGQQIYKELQSGKYGDALKTLGENALMFVAGPAAFGWGAKAGISSGLAGGIKSLASHTFGQDTFLETVSREVFGDAQAGFNYLNTKNDAELIKGVSSVVATNVAAEGGNEVKAAYRVLNGLRAAWPDLTQLTPDQFFGRMKAWADGYDLVRSELSAKGMSEADISKYALGRATPVEVNRIATAVTAGDRIPGGQTVEQRLGAFHDYLYQNPESAFAHNDNFIHQVETLILNNPDSTVLDEKIRDIKAAWDAGVVSKETADTLAKSGYVVIKPPVLDAPFKEGSGQITTKFVDKATDGTALTKMSRDNVPSGTLLGKTSQNDFFLKATTPVPILGHIGALLTGMGLSPNVANQRVYDIFNQNLVKNLSGVERLKAIGESDSEFADRISRQLSDFMKQPTRGGATLNGLHVRPPLTDMRQLTWKDIMKATGATQGEAHQLLVGIKNSMLQVPIAVRGLGDKVMDINYRINPLAALYSRVQGAARFAWNPIFQTKASFKSEFLSQLDTGGKFPTLAGTNWALKRIFPEHYSQLDDITNTLEDRGFFHGGYTQEGNNDVAAGYEKLTGGHAVLPGQRRSVAGVVGAMADRVGMSPQEFIDSFPAQTKDAVGAILQYNPKGNFINSPMARTLNMAFFPFRFNVKVAGFMARAIAREPVAAQYAIIAGTFRAHQFLTSPEGQAWYSQNAQLIGLFKYISPVAELSTVANVLTAGNAKDSVGAMGELGGLPFGFIPAMLQAEGLLNNQQPYVNPTTGAVATQYIPVTTRGQIQSAIEGLLGSLYTYPGATAGLTSKTTIDANVAKWFVPGGKTATDFSQNTPTNLTPEQQSFQHVVQQLHNASPQAQLPAQQQSVPQLNVPATPTPITTPLPKTTGASAKAVKLKKIQQPITPLPGQSSIGQV